jgi:antitoxin ParD1/3/4
MILSLPESLKTWVEEQAAQGGYASPAEYVQQVLYKEQQQQHKEEIERQLLAALDSGDPVEATPEFWEARRQELRTRLQRSRKAEDL